MVFSIFPVLRSELGLTDVQLGLTGSIFLWVYGLGCPIAVLTTAQIAGTVGGRWFGGWMAQQGRWRWSFFVLGAMGVLYGLPYFLFLRNFSEEAPVGTKKAGAGLALIELAKVPSSASSAVSAWRTSSRRL